MQKKAVSVRAHHRAADCSFVVCMACWIRLDVTAFALVCLQHIMNIFQSADVHIYDEFVHCVRMTWR